MQLNFAWSIIFIINGILPSFGQLTELKLIAEIKNPIANSQDDLLIKLTLSNQTGKKLLIHKHIAFGYFSICADDYCFEVERNVNNRYTKMKAMSSIDRIPGYDSTGMAWGEMYDTLNVGQSFLQEFNINGYYSFDKGKYRARFSFQLPAKNKLATKQIFSNWVYFAVKAKHIDLHL